MARDLDAIAQDIRDATHDYEVWDAKATHHQMKRDEALVKAHHNLDLMDQYRDELLEAVNR